MMPAQAEVVEVTGLIDMFAKYGATTVMLVLFVLATWWIGKRLLNEKNGLLTKYVESTNDLQKSLSESVEKQKETGTRVAALLETSEKRTEEMGAVVQRIEAMHYDPNSRFSTVTLGRCFLESLDVVESMSKKLDEALPSDIALAEIIRPSIILMRRDLETHLIAAEQLSKEG